MLHVSVRMPSERERDVGQIEHPLLPFPWDMNSCSPQERCKPSITRGNASLHFPPPCSQTVLHSLVLFENSGAILPPASHRLAATPPKQALLEPQAGQNPCRKSASLQSCACAGIRCMHATLRLSVSARPPPTQVLSASAPADTHSIGRHSCSHPATGACRSLASIISTKPLVRL